MDSKTDGNQEEEVVLETLCDMCEGEYTGNWREPCRCGGIGYRPTPLGEKILTLVGRHFSRMLKQRLNNI